MGRFKNDKATTEPQENIRHPLMGALFVCLKVSHVNSWFWNRAAYNRSQNNLFYPPCCHKASIVCAVKDVTVSCTLDSGNPQC